MREWIGTSTEHGSEVSADLPVRGASALGVSGGRGNPVIDLTNSLETGPGSGPSSCTSSPRQPSSPGDTTSDATIKSSSVGVATMDPVSALVTEQGDRHHNEHIQLARLIALALTQPPESSDSTQRQAILHAESAGALVDILRGQYQPPNSSAELAQLRVDLHSAETSNASLQKRLGSSLDQVAQLKLQLETSERECHIWKREVDKSVDLITSLRKALTASGAELKQARATAQTAERDEAYKILQGVSAKHFQQLQEIVLSLDDDGSHKLRHAKTTIDEMRETILRQKRVIRRQGFVPMHDPRMAAAAEAGLDVPGMDPASLKLNARLCRLLAERFPAVMRIPDGEDRVVELRICSRQSARQVNAQLLENLGTSDTLALGLGDRLSGAVGTRPNSSGSVSHPLELSSDSADDDRPSAADSAVGASTAAGDAPAEPASTTAKLSRLAQLFGSEDESDSGNIGDSGSADGPHTPVVTSSGPPQGKVQSYLAAGHVPPGPPPASASAGLPSFPSPTKKHRKGKKKHKHKHKHKAKSKHKGQHKSKREDHHKGQHKVTKSQAKRPRSPSPGKPSASDSGAPLKRHKVSARSPAAANSAPGPEPSPNSAGGSGTSPNSAGMTLPSPLSVSIAVLRTRAMQSASRDSRITPHQGEVRWSLTVLGLDFE
ncbi:Hypothetical protein PHPALM_17199 [Phytophthora palmivora]|uniref:Uncharacterized protein n=1 Tax=Phytophthora palmivora TaxID=4796 RepID=A0A2P4XMT4_9STRA|nr:Hypothetical protein PHPALM_17199 [Phytophthora palmivora]